MKAWELSYFKDCYYRKVGVFHLICHVWLATRQELDEMGTRDVIGGEEVVIPMKGGKDRKSEREREREKEGERARESARESKRIKIAHWNINSPPEER